MSAMVASLGLAGAVGHDGGVAGPVGHLDGVQGLGQGADLVDLDEDGVAHLLLNAGLEPLGVGDEQVVAHQLDAVADGLGEHGPSPPSRSRPCRPPGRRWGRCRQTSSTC